MKGRRLIIPVSVKPPGIIDATRRHGLIDEPKRKMSGDDRPRFAIFWESSRGVYRRVRSQGAR